MPNPKFQNVAGTKPAFFYGYIVVVTAFLIQMFMFGAFYSFGVFFKPVAAEFGWSRAAIAGAFTSMTFLSGIFSIVMGRLNDRLGPRLVLTVGGLFLGVGYLLMSQISAIWQLYLFYGVVIAVGMSVGYVPVVSTVARWFVKRRGLMTGLVVSSIGLGTLIIPPVASLLIISHGWRYSYLVIGIVVLAVIILAAQFMRRDPSTMGQLPYGESKVAQEDSSFKAVGLSLQEAARTVQFWICGAIFLCFNYCIQAIMVHIAPHATELGISTTIAASILGVIGGASIVGRIVAGSAVDKIGNRSTLIVAFSLAVVALFWLQLAKETWMLYLFAASFGFAYGFLPTLQSPMVAELFGLGSHGAILGSLVFAATIGGIGTVITGHIFDITGSYSQAFLLCAAIAILGLILTWFLKPTKMTESA